jgi:hypothetical protein
MKVGTAEELKATANSVVSVKVSAINAWSYSVFRNRVELNVLGVVDAACSWCSIASSSASSASLSCKVPSKYVPSFLLLVYFHCLFNAKVFLSLYLIIDW